MNTSSYQTNGQCKWLLVTVRNSSCRSYLSTNTIKLLRAQKSRLTFF
uniref:Uncharacterized protein n=1 Tax=Rhizophora mucronata TaxID=61149 RepID=A0A2P2Q5I7_RHIMU